MNTPLDLEPSHAIFEEIGNYETEKTWATYKDGVHTMGGKDLSGVTELTSSEAKGDVAVEKYYPAPTFAEVLRILTKIGEKKGWTAFSSEQFSTTFHAETLLRIYMSASSEEEGMRAVGEYLIKLL